MALHKRDEMLLEVAQLGLSTLQKICEIGIFGEDPFFDVDLGGIPCEA